MAAKRVTDDLVSDVLKVSVVEGMLPRFIDTLVVAAAITIVLLAFLFYRHHQRCYAAKVNFLGQPTTARRTLADVQELAEEAERIRRASERKFFWQKKADA